MLCSVDWVKRELERGNDYLAQWAKKVFARWFDSTADKDIVECYGEVMNWVNRQRQFYDWAKRDFASGADGWLLAYAMVRNKVLVTQEQFKANVKK
nr:DUF4411 family protein [Syntrophothermus lipocalidus]